MNDKDFAELKARLNQALKHTRAKVTLRSKDVPLPIKLKTIQPQEIVRLRRHLNASQGVFARWLNVSRDTAISWETGRRKPSGAALRLLQIVQADPEILPRAATNSVNFQLPTLNAQRPTKAGGNSRKKA